MSWTGLLEFKDDMVTNYSRPAPTVESSPDDAQNRNPSVTKTQASPSTISPKSFIKFVKATDSPTNSKTDKAETAKKPPVKKFPTANRKFPTGDTKFSTADIGKKGKAATYPTSLIMSHLMEDMCLLVKEDARLLANELSKPLSDDDNVLLRTPRQHNMYSIDLNNIIPHKDLTCLVAKASADEYMLRHRRLGHLNFKTMNKLVRHNLVRGLPTKCFENDHTCTAFLKGKQHKASCKSKLVNSAEAVNIACYVQNRVLVNKSQNKTPYELFNGRTPAIGFLKPFGYHVMILDTLENLGKFEAKVDDGYFIGYSMSSKAFRVFNKRTRRVKENLHVEFLENKAIEKGTKDAASKEVKKDVSSLRYIALPNWVHDALLESSSKTLTVETSIPTVSSLVPTACLNDSPEPSSDTRLISKGVANQVETPSLDNILTLTNRFEDILGVTTNSVDSDGVEANISNMETTIIASPTPILKIHKDHPKKPKKIFDALQDPSWVEAMQEELLQFKIQNVWTLVDCPKGEEGIDYDEVFAPVVRIEAIGLFLAHALFMGFTVYQMDVKSDFLYGTIDEEVYVMQPPGFHDLEFPAKVYKLEKAMYGLHQAPRAWYGTLSKYLLTNGFQRGTIDQTLFIRRQRGDFILVQVYVDDIIFGSSIHSYAENLKPLCMKNFKWVLWVSLTSSLVCKFYRRRMAFFSIKTEYVAAASCCGQVLWIQNQLLDYGEVPVLSRTSKYWGILRILMISLRLTLLVSKDDTTMTASCKTCWSSSPLRHCDSEQRTHEFIHVYLASVSVYVWIGNTIMARIQFCDYHNMVAILEKSEYNFDFHPIVDFVEASPLRIETTKEGTKILVTVDSILRTITESSLRRNLKLKDEEGISSLPDATLFENLTLMGYNISPNQKFTFQKDLCTSLQRQHSEMVAKFEARELEINRLKARVKLLEDREGVAAKRSRDNAPIKGRNLDEGEAAAKRDSDDTEEMATVLTSIDAATVLASGVAKVPTGNRSIPTAGPPAVKVPTGSDVVLTAGPIFATATVVTPYTRRKGKKRMVESETLKKKKVQEQIDAQVARELEEQMVREDQRMTEQVARDVEIARIHVEEELQIIIDGLDKSNETVAKYMQEYHQFASELPLERRIELISDLVRGMTFQEIKAKFTTVWKQIENFITMGSKEEAERLKRKGLSLEQESVKKLKTSESVLEEVKSTDEVPEEKVKEMMQLVPIEEVYVKALQVKHPIIDWKGRIVGNKMHKAFPLPVKEFPLLEEVPTASEESSYCQKKREATAVKIAMLLKSRRNCQLKSDNSYTKGVRVNVGSFPMHMPYVAWYLELTTGQLVNGSSCDGIDMVIKKLDSEPKIFGPSRWKELRKETSSKILLCGDGSCWKTFKPIASLIAKGKLK
nr:hypothetical protein [Tanacetum cinerariifolium]